MDSNPVLNPANIEMVRQLVYPRYRETIEVQFADSKLVLNLSMSNEVVSQLYSGACKMSTSL